MFSIALFLDLLVKTVIPCIKLIPQHLEMKENGHKNGMGFMKCLKCRTKNPEMLVYCQECGSYLPTDPMTGNWDLLKSAVLGLFTTAFFYIVFPLPMIHSSYFQNLFSGHISETITALSCCSLFLIGFKYLQYREQYKTYRLFFKREVSDLLDRGIRMEELEQRLTELTQVLWDQGAKRFQNSLIFRRIRRVFQYVQAVPKKEEIDKILDYQAEIDFHRIENGYTLLNVLIWAIPILGFIGTVFGIGEAIGEFSKFIQSVNSVELGSQMRSALSGVTSGLSIAFNTTFLALVFVIPIMICSSLLRKMEDDLLSRIEEYCLEEVLPNLQIPSEETNLLKEQSQQLTDVLNQWTTLMQPLMISTTEQAQLFKSQIQGLQPLVRELSEHLIPLLKLQQKGSL